MYLQLNLLYIIAFYYVYLLAKAVHEFEKKNEIATVYGFHQIIFMLPKNALCTLHITKVDMFHISLTYLNLLI